MPKSLSRNAYVLEKLFEINGTKNMSKLLQIIFDPRHFIKDQTKDIQIAVDNINPLLQQDGYRLENIDSRFKVIGADLPDEIEIEIHFEEIQSQIIEQIRLAKYSIWLAVAWLTDKELLRELYKKRQDGVNVRMIILDDEINNKYGIEYEKFFEIKRYKAS
jgi:phosphatidylserine/phosphatidylglycerophosphate/cardiolipin synthase-like enzyme